MKKPLLCGIDVGSKDSSSPSIWVPAASGKACLRTTLPASAITLLAELSVLPADMTARQ